LTSFNDVTDQIDAVDLSATNALTQRISEMGVMDSGAYNFYNVRAERKRLTIPLELKVRDLILEMAAEFDFDNIHDIGAGIGTLAMSFAAKGVPAVAVERDSRRHAAMVAIHEAVGVSHSDVASLFTPLLAAIPSAEVEAARSRNGSVAVITNFVATIPADIQLEIISALSEYVFAIIDVQRYCETRMTPEDYASVVTMFLDNGFDNAEKVLDLGSEGVYYRFTRR